MGLYDPNRQLDRLGSLFGAAPSKHAANQLLGGLGSLPPAGYPLGSLLGNATTIVKRKAYFAFKFEDVMRVNNVRNAWKITHPNNQLMRSFYDSSLWESKKLESDDALKKLMRDGVEHTSAICILIGTDTWSSRWVKYEIARSVIDGRGLLAVHLNSLNHHIRKQPDLPGYNPLHLLGIFKKADGKFYLYELRQVVMRFLGRQKEWRWLQYEDYTLAVPLPRYLDAPSVGYVMPLSTAVPSYDYIADVGHSNIGSWIDHAAKAVGR